MGYTLIMALLRKVTLYFYFFCKKNEDAKTRVASSFNGLNDFGLEVVY